MRFLLTTLLTASLAFVAGLYFPWWSLALVAFVVALLIPQSFGAAFLSAFAGILVAWAGTATWLNLQNGGLLAGKVARLLPLGGSSLLLVFVSALVGALTGGFAALSGSSLYSLFQRKA